MSSKVPEDQKDAWAAYAPEQSPLRVPLGGGAVDSPYSDYDVASENKWRFDWDPKTRRLVWERVHNVPLCLFFTAEEVERLEAICARLLPQEDRTPNDRIPIVPWIDQRLHQDEGDGYRYADMPSDQEAYRHGLRGFAEIAQHRFEKPFEALSGDEQDDVIEAVASGHPPGATWKELPPRRFFTLLMKDVITNYYAHPAAWTEIGFNGPASPRGHIRIWLGGRDPWEAEERRTRSSVDIVQRALKKRKAPSDE
jgi:hypothetical protein